MSNSSSPPSPEVGMVEQDLREAIARIIDPEGSPRWTPEAWAFWRKHRGGRIPDALAKADAILQLPAISLATRDLKPAASGALEWRDIASAPRDGSAFLAYGSHPETGERWEVVFYDPAAPDGSGVYTAGRAAFHGREEWCWSTQDGPTLHRDGFSHWTPLLAPSTPPQVEREGSRDDLEALEQLIVELRAPTHSGPPFDPKAVYRTRRMGLFTETADALERLIATNRELKGERDYAWSEMKNAQAYWRAETANAEAAEASNRELLERLRALEDACEAMAAGRSSRTYDSILRDGGSDALLALDNARWEARTTISHALSKSEGSRDEG